MTRDSFTAFRRCIFTRYFTSCWSCQLTISISEAQVREKKERDERERMRQKSPYPAPLPTSTRRAAPNYQPVPTYSDPLSSTLQQVSYPSNIPQQPTTLRPYPAQNPNTHPAQASQLQPTIPSNTLPPANSQQMSTVTNPPPQVLNLAPKSPTQVLAGSPTQGRMLGQGTWVDPVEMERRQEARKRALENQVSIASVIACTCDLTK